MIADVGSLGTASGARQRICRRRLIGMVALHPASDYAKSFLFLSLLPPLLCSCPTTGGSDWRVRPLSYAYASVLFAPCADSYLSPLMPMTPYNSRLSPMPMTTPAAAAASPYPYKCHGPSRSKSK